MLERLKSMWGGGRLWRGLYLLAVFSFLMPFVTVYTRSCATGTFVRTGESHGYYGFQLIIEKNGLLYLFPISLAILLLSLTFVRRQRTRILEGFSSSWKATLSLLSAALIAALPWFQFSLQHDVEARIGQILGVASWATAYLASLVSALISLVEAKRTGGVHPPGTPQRFIAYRAAYLTMILPAIALWGASIFALTTQPYDRSALILSGGIVSLLLPLCLAAYFFNRGLLEEEHWAVQSGRWTILLLSAVGVIALTLFGTGVLPTHLLTKTFWSLLVWLAVIALVGIGGILARSHNLPLRII